LQSVSAELQAAILAQERQPLCRLRVDWDRSGSFTDLAVKDLSADVVNVSLPRELATDLPAQAKLFAGQAAAEATITLATKDPGGDPAKHTAWKYSPLNSASPLFGYDRKAAPARLEFGFAGTAGPEYVTVLEGSVRSLNVTSGGRVAVMRVVDGAETMRRQVTLPMVVADGEDAAGNRLRPGLRTTWLASHIFRACGWYPQPPARSSCKFLATMAGSAYPEIGTMRNCVGVNGEQPGFCPTTTHTGAAKFVMGMATSGSGNPEVSYNFAGTGLPSVNNGSTMLVEGWYKFRSTAQDQPLWITFTSGGAGRYASAYWRTADGRIDVTFNRGGGQQFAIAGPTLTGDTTTWHYLGFHISFASTGVTAIFRVDGATTSPAQQATTSITGQEIMDTIAVDHGRVGAFADASNNLFQEAVQLTVESSPGTWNNAFVPTVDIRTSTAVDTKLMATPPTTEEAWSLLQQVALAEFATTGFDETGRPYYWPRDRWTTAPYTTSQRTLTAATSLKELETVEAVDQIRNRVVVRATQVEVQPSGIVWRSAQAHTIPASGARTMWPQFDNPVANLDTSVVSQLAGGTSRYLAANRRDGGGTAVANLGITVTAFAQSAKLAWTNPNAFVVYMVADGSIVGATAGAPYIVLEGQFVLFDQQTNTVMRVEVSDATSIAAYDEQLLELADSPFRQDLDQVEGVAADLLADLKQAGPALSDVPAVGDPRIQLGDRLTIVDAEGLGFTADFHCSKVAFEFSPEEGLAMVLSLRAA
jgi:hypothetical protein